MPSARHACHTPVTYLFVGPYALTSLAYIQSCECTATPLIVSQVVVVFELYYTINNPPPFTLGGPVTVTIRHFSPLACGMGYTLYGMVKELIQSNTSSSDIKHLLIIVELHMIPRHFMLWWEQLDPQLWAMPPAYT